MKAFVFALLMTVSLAAQARIEALFHPHDPTLETIAQWIYEAESTVDIAMYNLESGPASPIIQTIQSPPVQARIRNGSLKIRMVLELYGTPEENTKKRQAMEDLGVDVRYLGRSVKVHHKFAVIDSLKSVDRVITGSANWSLSSYRGYNENILFFTQEPEATSRYQTEFNRLWLNSVEFGFTGPTPEITPVPFVDQEGMEVYFNSPKRLEPGSSEKSNLTNEIVNLINSSQSHLQIASTRIRLIPVLEALQAAAVRGVKVQAVISQDDFMDLGKRAKYLLSNPNIDLRVKFYNLQVAEYMTYQMHNKFMIVDGHTLVTGSFNWSSSSENNHIENIVILSGRLAQEVLPSYENEFASIWNLGRTEFPSVLEALKNQMHHECSIPKMALYPKEIRQLLKFKPQCK